MGILRKCLHLGRTAAEVVMGLSSTIHITVHFPLSKLVPPWTSPPRLLASAGTQSLRTATTKHNQAAELLPVLNMDVPVELVPLELTAPCHLHGRQPTACPPLANSQQLHLFTCGLPITGSGLVQYS